MTTITQPLVQLTLSALRMSLVAWLRQRPTSHVPAPGATVDVAVKTTWVGPTNPDEVYGGDATRQLAWLLTIELVGGEVGRCARVSVCHKRGVARLYVKL